MLKQGRLLALILFFMPYLTGCIGSLWTGASLVYDRHNGYKKLTDYRLTVKVTNALYFDKKFKAEHCSLDLVVFNRDILITGHLPSEQMLDEARFRLSKVTGYRRLFNAITINNTQSNSMQDTWITTKIRSRIFADSSIDPNAFKVITTDGVVYLMGDVKPDEAVKVIAIARQTAGVAHVVKILKYFIFTSSNKVA